MNNTISKKIDDGFSDLANKIDDGFSELGNKIDDLGNKIDALGNKINDGFSGLKEYLSQLFSQYFGGKELADRKSVV